MKTIAWCTSHYLNSYAKEVAEKLRGRGYKVRFNSYIKENGNTYCKVYLVKDLNYEVHQIMSSMSIMLKAKSRNEKIEVGYEEIYGEVQNNVEKIKEICINYGIGLKFSIEYDYNEEDYLFIANINSNDDEVELTKYLHQSSILVD